VAAGDCGQGATKCKVASEYDSKKLSEISGFMAVMLISWVVMSCGLVLEKCIAYIFTLQGEDVGNMFL
jgi:hypothetical protein